MSLPKPNVALSGTSAATASITVKPLSIPMHLPFSISREVRPVAEVAVVEIEDDQGLCGLGEAAPFPSLTGDTIDEAVSTCEALAAQLSGQPAHLALSRLYDMRSEVFPHTPTAFVALEMALWDLRAKQEQVPLRHYFGKAALKEVATDITLPIMKPATVPFFWSLFAKHEFEIVKIKVSGHVDADFELVEALTQTAGPKVKLTLDGNQAYRVQSARELVERLEGIGLKPLFFEQPLPADDWEGHKRLSESLPVPICLDETVRSTDDMLRVIRENTATMVNLKIMKSGMAETLAIAGLAAANNIRLMIGGMLETEIAMTASLQLYCGSGFVSFADLDTPFFMKERVTTASPWHDSSARLMCPSGHGLGLYRR